MYGKRLAITSRGSELNYPLSWQHHQGIFSLYVYILVYSLCLFSTKYVSSYLLHAHVYNHIYLGIVIGIYKCSTCNLSNSEKKGKEKGNHSKTEN